MIIQDSKTIKDIQQEFHGLFPGLKLEFYRNPHENFKGSPKENQYPHSTRLFDIRTHHTEGEFNISPEMTVKQLEDLFEELYELHVQVFRKSNQLWLQTTTTDHWTIGEQNRKGLKSTEPTSTQYEDL